MGVAPFFSVLGSGLFSLQRTTMDFFGQRTTADCPRFAADDNELVVVWQRTTTDCSRFAADYNGLFWQRTTADCSEFAADNNGLKRTKLTGLTGRTFYESPMQRIKSDVVRCHKKVRCCPMLPKSPLLSDAPKKVRCRPMLQKSPLLSDAPKKSDVVRCKQKSPM